MTAAKYELFLIVPAETDQAGYCRIVHRSHDDPMFGAMLSNYRRTPSLWEEAGRMNSRGELVCLNAPAHVFQALKQDEPLMASQENVYSREFYDDPHHVQ